MAVLFREETLFLNDIGKHMMFLTGDFLKSETPDEIRKTFMHTWISVYTGFPDTVATSHVTCFNSLL